MIHHAPKNWRLCTVEICVCTRFKCVGFRIYFAESLMDCLAPDTMSSFSSFAPRNTSSTHLLTEWQVSAVRHAHNTSHGLPSSVLSFRGGDADLK